MDQQYQKLDSAHQQHIGVMSVQSQQYYENFLLVTG